MWGRIEIRWSVLGREFQEWDVRGVDRMVSYWACPGIGMIGTAMVYIVGMGNAIVGAW